MYAVIETGGKQYRVELGSELAVERLDAMPGTTINIDRVLLVADGDTTQIGTPIVADALVTADVLRQDRGEKLIVFKYRPKARHRSKKGHRQEQTVLRVADIRFNGRSAADEAGTEQKDKESERKKAQAAAEKKAAADQALASKLAAESEAKAEGEVKAESAAKTNKAADDKPDAKTTTRKPAATKPAATKAAATKKVTAASTAKTAASTAKTAAAKADAPVKPAAKAETKSTTAAKAASKSAAADHKPKPTRSRTTRTSTTKDE